MHNSGHCVLLLLDGSLETAAFARRFGEVDAGVVSIAWSPDWKCEHECHSILAVADQVDPRALIQHQTTLKERYPHAAIGWAVPSTIAPSTVAKLVQAGAVTVVSLSSSASELRETTTDLASAAAAKQVQAEKRAAIHLHLVKLSDDERKVMNLIIAGSSNKAIASALGIGLRTVEKRRHQVFRKLSAGSIPDIVRIRYVEEGLLEPSIFDRYPLSDEVTE